MFFAWGGGGRNFFPLLGGGKIFLTLGGEVGGGKKFSATSISGGGSLKLPYRSAPPAPQKILAEVYSLGVAKGEPCGGAGRLGYSFQLFSEGYPPDNCHFLNIIRCIFGKEKDFKSKILRGVSNLLPSRNFQKLVKNAIRLSF